MRSKESSHVDIAGLLVRHRLHQPSDLGSAPPLSPYQLAFLSRGHLGLLQTVAAQLVCKGLLCVNTEKRALEAVEPTGSDEITFQSSPTDILSSH